MAKVLAARMVPHMIAMETMHSTSPLARRAVLLGLSALAGCAAQSALTKMPKSSDIFLMPDGAELPYRLWPAVGQTPGESHMADFRHFRLAAR
jgi:hypothetical protein